MLTNTEKQGADTAPTKFETSDIILLLGILFAVLTLAGILVFAEGAKRVMLGILWGWLVNLSVWIYLIVSAI